MAILKIKDADGNIYDIPAIRGPQGDPYTLTEEDKEQIVKEVLESFIKVSEVAL